MPVAVSGPDLEQNLPRIAGHATGANLNLCPQRMLIGAEAARYVDRQKVAIHIAPGGFRMQGVRPDVRPWKLKPRIIRLFNRAIGHFNQGLIRRSAHLVISTSAVTHRLEAILTDRIIGVASR